MKNNSLTPSEMEVAHSLRQLRLKIGMNLPGFGKLIGMESRVVSTRESFLVAWRKSEIDSLLMALRSHLASSLKETESLTLKLSPQPTQKSE